MSDNSKNKIIQLLQGKWYPNYVSQGSRKCNFRVVYAHYSDSLMELALVLEVEDEEMEDTSYVLEKFQVGTERYFDLIGNAYGAEFNENKIVAVCVDDFLDFSGSAMFDWVEGYKQINLRTYEPDTTPCSPLSVLYRNE